MLQTEFKFTLPKGYVDENGNLHKDGIMRLATGADEILPQKDPRVQKNSSYLIIILLSRVITRIGGSDQITPKIIENLFVEDIDFLEKLYNQINGYAKMNKIQCPKCSTEFEFENSAMGE